MVNKKGWLKIVESFFAVIIITTAVLIVIVNQGTVRLDLSDEIQPKQESILEAVANEEVIRAEILSTSVSGDPVENVALNEFINKLVPAGWNYTAVVCNLEDICNPLNIPLDKEIYVAETIIVANLNQYDPKKVKFFVWIED